MYIARYLKAFAHKNITITIKNKTTMKNFDFIKELAEEIPAFHQLHAYCDKAEIFQKAFPEESAANARKALEWLVKTIWRWLTLPSPRTKP